MSMYGTRDAASNWEDKYASHLIACGLTQGKSPPCIFFHKERGIRCVVHGDDFTFLGNDEGLDFATTVMKEEYDINLRGVLAQRKGIRRVLPFLIDALSGVKMVFTMRLIPGMLNS